MNENDAFCKIVDRYKGNKAIFIADRGYESYNGFEHVNKTGNKYLIRVRDIDLRHSITQSFGPYPDEEFDLDVFRMLTLKQTNMTKVCKQLYKFVPSNARFDFMSKEDPWYEFNCRVVRFKITDMIHMSVLLLILIGRNSLLMVLKTHIINVGVLRLHLENLNTPLD